MDSNCFNVSPCSYQNKSDSHSPDAIVRDINIFKNDGNILLCGDLNARTGSDQDFIQDDNDKHISLDLSYITDTNITRRCSEDHKIDGIGKQLKNFGFLQD